ncbi:SUMF1/EgtB/PvdO family nonheme iron enzyme [Rapidithrix thailandica]|uniref:SUMF1/EgtB/PvdO family nonheme iron enzyme n=1 Tax=Rapidithrix thailandica TaxID=413964 RepID=A0AAW9S6Q7_9BACT
MNLRRMKLAGAFIGAWALSMPFANAQEAFDESSAFETYVDSIPGTGISFKMVPIPGGEFMIGSPEAEANRKEDEGPQKKVKLEPFWMLEVEVPFEMYEIFRDKTKDLMSNGETYVSESGDPITRPSPPYEDPTFGMGKYGYPAASMTQYAALSFCKWLSNRTGKFYRLPTEAEWEYACRAGSNTAYSYGDDPEQLEEYAWYYDNADDAYQKVAQKKPNAWGLYDMHGNVAEWTLDQYDAEFYANLKKEINENPWRLPTSLHPRTVKGGSYYDDPEDLRSAKRTESSMSWKRRDPQIPKSFWWNTDSPFVGFRIIRPAKDMSKEEIAKFWSSVLDE